MWKRKGTEFNVVSRGGEEVALRICALPYFNSSVRRSVTVGNVRKR